MTQQAPRPYHHGDLRRVLLDVALDVITETSLDRLTLREVARRAGVSHTACYRHYPDKAALLEALTVESYKRFTAVLRHTRDHTPGLPLEQLAAVGVHYVRYALEQPTQFRLMHRPELRGHDQQHPGPAEQAAREAFTVLLDLITAGQHAGQVAPLAPHVLALTAWATVHGLAVLLSEGLLLEDAHLHELPEMIVRALGHGLLSRSAPQP